MMAWVRFTAKMLFAMLAPALLAFALSNVWTALFPPAPIFPQGDTWSDKVFGLLILGLLVLSIILPALLAIREIQKNKSCEEGPLFIGSEPGLMDELWK